MLGRVRLFVTPWTVAHQAPPSLGFSRQERWGGLPFPPPVHGKVKVKSLGRVRLFATPRTAAHQAPPSLALSRRGSWGGCRCLLRIQAEGPLLECRSRDAVAVVFSAPQHQGLQGPCQTVPREPRCDGLQPWWPGAQGGLELHTGRERALGRHGRPWLAVLGLPSSAAWLYAERLLLQEPERPVCDCLPPPDRGDARLGHSLACWLLWGKSNRLCVTVRRRRPRPCSVG